MGAHLLERSLTDLMAEAAARRDATTGSRITYSPKVFVPLTMLCRDRCQDCKLSFLWQLEDYFFSYSVMLFFWKWWQLCNTSRPPSIGQAGMKAIHYVGFTLPCPVYRF